MDQPSPPATGALVRLAVIGGTNPLVALGSVAEISNTPASKSVVITIEPAPAVAGARRLSRPQAARLCEATFHAFFYEQSSVTMLSEYSIGELGDMT